MQTIINIEDPRVFLTAPNHSAIREIRTPEFYGWEVCGTARFERGEWCLSTKFDLGHWHLMKLKEWNEEQHMKYNRGPVPTAIAELKEGFAHAKGRREIIHYRKSDGLYYDVHGEEIPYDAILAWTEI